MIYALFELSDFHLDTGIPITSSVMDGTGLLYPVVRVGLCPYSVGIGVRLSASQRAEWSASTNPCHPYRLRWANLSGQTIIGCSAPSPRNVSHAIVMFNSKKIHEGGYREHHGSPNRGRFSGGIIKGADLPYKRRQAQASGDKDTMLAIVESGKIFTVSIARSPESTPTKRVSVMFNGSDMQLISSIDRLGA